MIFFEWVWKHQNGQYWEFPLVEFHARCYNILKQVLTLPGWYKWRCRSSSKVNRYQQKEHNDDNDIGLHDIVIENAKIRNCNNAEENGGKLSLPGFLGGLFSHSRLAVVSRARIEGRICCSMMLRCIVSNFRKITRILRYCRRQHYSRRPTWAEYWWTSHFNDFNLFSLYTL